MKSESDSPHVITFPPFIFLLAIGAGALLDRIVSIELLPGNFTIPLGLFLTIVSIVLFVSAATTFVRAGTNVDVRKPTTRIVASGPYRFTRNPIYLAMTLL